jgi:hypothetical protein
MATRRCRPPWWDGSVIYHCYPRSYADANGDGIGDLAGITEHLDHLAGGPDALGVDAIWLSPIYPHGGVDGGYDVIDHVAVAPEYGNLVDFDRFVTAAHEPSPDETPTTGTGSSGPIRNRTAARPRTGSPSSGGLPGRSTIGPASTTTTPTTPSNQI